MVSVSPGPHYLSLHPISLKEGKGGQTSVYRNLKVPKVLHVA